MATGLAARKAAAGDPTFQLRVSEAVTEAAVAIYSEAANTPGHVARIVFANDVLLNPDKYTLDFALALVGQSLDTGSTDTAISTGVASVWNALALA